jgi:spore maturation protein CgeB
MIEKICILVHDNLYASKRHFAEYFAAALRRQGVEVHLIDTGGENADPSRLYDLYINKPDLTCSFNSLKPVKPGDTQYLCDYLQVPHWSILVDPALYYLDQTQSPWICMSYVDRNDGTGLADYGFHRSFFWPHAVERDLILQKTEEERPYDITFSGTCYDYLGLQQYWQTELSQQAGVILEDAARGVLAPGYTSLMQGLTEAYRSFGAHAVNVDLEHLFFLLDYYTRGVDRIQLVQNLAHQHTVHVFGAPFGDHVASIRGWEEYLKDFPNAHVHSPVDFTMAMTLMRRSKIYLNSMPFFKDGSHERILAALACGALPVTSDSRWVRENFVDGEDIIIYTADERDSIGERIAPLLADEERRRVMVARGRQKVLQHHTWDQRASAALEIMPLLLQQMMPNT